MDPQLLKSLEKKNLRYLSDDVKGIKRMGKGNGFLYLDVNGAKISNENILKRIESLGIPPAWKEVWISPFAHSHLQVTGLDEKGRKQYLYHPLWIELSQESKFSHLTDFALTLPEVRKKISSDMKMPKLVREKVLATVVWLLEHTFIRIGNEEYAKDNNSFGLTTLRNRHVKISGGRVKFEFKGKSGVDHTVDVMHPLVIKTIKKCSELPGFELFRYIDENNKPRTIDSGEVNEYLKSITGEDVSAKDFRTWGATVISAVTLSNLGRFDKEEEIKQKIAQTVKVVAKRLRNTPNVCRNYYIHPVVIDTYRKDLLVPYFVKEKSKKLIVPNRLSTDEFIVVSLLQKYS